MTNNNENNNETNGDVRREKVGSIKNTWGPLSLIILVPILLFSVLIRSIDCEQEVGFYSSCLNKSLNSTQNSSNPMRYFS